MQVEMEGGRKTLIKIDEDLHHTNTKISIFHPQKIPSKMDVKR